MLECEYLIDLDAASSLSYLSQLRWFYITKNTDNMFLSMR